MNFTLGTPIPLISSSPHTCPLPLQLTPSREKYLIVEAVVCHSVSHSVPLVHTSLLANAHGNESDMRPLASASLSILEPVWDSFQISCCCPVSWRSYSFGSVGPASSCTLARHLWDRSWMGQLKALDLPERYLSWSSHQLSHS